MALLLKIWSTWEHTCRQSAGKSWQWEFLVWDWLWLVASIWSSIHRAVAAGWSSV